MHRSAELKRTDGLAVAKSHADHPQVVVRLPAIMGGGSVEVDRDLEHLLREVWRRVWFTFASCQDANADGRTAQLVFDRGTDVVEFLAVAEIDDRVGARVLLASSRSGPHIDTPTAVYFDRHWIGPAAERLAASGPREQWSRLRGDRLKGGRDV